MRDIEFRGKEIKTGKWIFGEYISMLGRDDVLTHFICPDHTGHSIELEGFKYPVLTPGYPVDPETVYEFTGLLDCKKVKIFEGDIVLYKGIKCLVRWDSEKAGFFIGKDKYWMMNDTSIEVIGNLHDNPDLLEDI
jgi:uncharacterized phage protein (TIGR01671 family)